MRGKVRASSDWALLVSLQGFRRSISVHEIPILQQADLSLSGTSQLDEMCELYLYPTCYLLESNCFVKLGRDLEGCLNQ